MTLSSIAITTFVMFVVFYVPLPLHDTDVNLGRSFAIGLGPIPFAIIPEVAPSHVSVFTKYSNSPLTPSKAVSAISSVGLSVDCEHSFAPHRLISDVGF